MNILHFCDSANAWNVRLQRFVQNDLNMGSQPSLFVRESALTPNNRWIPDADKVFVETYKRSRLMHYLLSPYDHLELKMVYNNLGCELVHAHNLACAYYSYKLGLPTLFNDWEYHYSYFDLESPLHSRLSMPLRLYRRGIAKKTVRKLLEELPVIVTNRMVEEKYRSLGAQRVWTVPNVPTKYEVDFAAKFKAEKRENTTTCYVGNLTRDSHTKLRNTKGIRELWRSRDLGELLALEGANYVPHLEVFRVLKSCHYNLLYWRPLRTHKYYLQNKPFLASVVDVPTIISSSLTATTELLGEYAIPVKNLEEVEKAVRSNTWEEPRQLQPTHLLEYWRGNITEAYKTL